MELKLWQNKGEFAKGISVCPYDLHLNGKEREGREDFAQKLTMLKLEERRKVVCRKRWSKLALYI